MSGNAEPAPGVQAARQLAALGRVEIAPGLTDGEVARVERAFGFEFADDHRSFLQAGLPVGSRSWPDWRDGDAGDLRRRLDGPVDGVLFDVEHNGDWYPAWGPRPDDPRESLLIARRHLARVPRMVPVYSHRYLPAGRGQFRHPVLSMHQTDIIVYGLDLADYIGHEFGGPTVDQRGLDHGEVVTVEFWRDIVAWWGLSP
ncbi:hypothetical protein Lfu02_73130 [Longispora fulva]|uniref:SMI1/KNR4 family protein n=1 Tax=Longispora fulva TaxID=619741 RepID=A0A8J7G6R0_9ACTN|nr:hypothetical protein [Longispora fulva]MBG6133900.1 hypothetical protein [Longispora fulva]GIG62941.1 hypothetical protein Lfu02_73130 [Longispora fulva]